VNNEKYIGLDVHQATISVAVLDSTGKVVMESILETKAATILQFFAVIRVWAGLGASAQLFSLSRFTRKHRGKFGNVCGRRSQLAITGFSTF